MLCNFSTEIKSQFVTHNQTQKHLSNQLLMEKEKDIIIQQKDMEIMKLKAQLEFAERIINGFQRGSSFQKGSSNLPFDTETEHISCSDFINEFKQLPLVSEEASDEMLESEADKKILSGLDNETFMSKQALNELPYYEVFMYYVIKINKPNTLGEVAYNILKNGSIDISDKYKNRFKIYMGSQWCSIEDSRDILEDLINTIKNMFSNYYKLYCNVYKFSIETKEIEPIEHEQEKQLKQINMRIRNVDNSEEIKHFLSRF